MEKFRKCAGIELNYNDLLIHEGVLVSMRNIKYFLKGNYSTPNFGMLCIPIKILLSTIFGLWPSLNFHKQYLPIKPQGYFRLISVKVVSPNTCDGLNMCSIIMQDIFVKLNSFCQVMQSFINPSLEKKNYLNYYKCKLKLDKSITNIFMAEIILPHIGLQEVTIRFPNLAIAVSKVTSPGNLSSPLL